MSREDALKVAKDVGLDLVEISPEAKPPVAKVVDWGKFNYQKTKQLQKNKRNTKAIELKQMRFGLKIGEHDLLVKTNKIQKFLDDGNKVKVSIFFRGREMAHKDLGFNLASKIISNFNDKIVIDQEPQLNGKQISFVIRSSNAKAKNS